MRSTGCASQKSSASLGHKNLQSLQSYKSANERHQRQMSYILSGSNQSQNGQQITAPSASNSGQLMSSTQQSHSQLSLQHTTNSLAVNNASVPAASNGVFPGANISSISGCQSVSHLQSPSEVDPTREKAP